MDLSELIRRRRLACALTQAQLAERVGATQATVNRWEQGKAVPQTPTLMRLVETLDIRGEDLLEALGMGTVVARMKLPARPDLAVPQGVEIRVSPDYNLSAGQRRALRIVLEAFVRQQELDNKKAD